MSSLPTITSLAPLRPAGNPSLAAPTDFKHKLTRKQKLFVEFYIQGFSPSQAALKAGYSGTTSASAHQSILYQTAVQSELKRRAHEIYRDIELTTEDIVDKYRTWADANVLDYIDINPEDGSKYSVNLNKIDRRQASCITELSYDPNGNARFKLVDQKSATDTLVRIRKIGVEEKSDEKAPLTIQALDAIVQSVTITNNTIINNTIENKIQDKTENKEAIVGEVVISPVSSPKATE